MAVAIHCGRLSSGALSLGYLLLRRILGALVSPPPNPAALDAAGERGLLRELALPPLRCVVTEGICVTVLSHMTSYLFCDANC